MLKIFIRRRISFVKEFMERPKQTIKRDKLTEFEKEAQKIWEATKVFESDPKPGQKKFMITFPYPYMNGKLHLGHAFSFSKSEFTARFKRLTGHNVLMPFGFHCTGMPICAAALKLNEELTEESKQKETPTKNNLTKMDVPESEVKEFIDPVKWVKYFPNFAKEDLISFGSAIDFRRSFVTTDINPYYDSFIEWQFTVLKEKGLVVFGKRPSIFSPKDGQMCADHDRATGEGVGPQEYTLIKMQIVDLVTPSLKKLEGKKVFLVAATLRPETMIGQTNCFVLPGANYGIFEMKNDEYFVCSDRSALNMAYQGLTKVEEKVEKVGEINGDELMGAKLKAPVTSYEFVYALPMLAISMTKGTGIVTSVPSDSPDDFATLRDLKNKPAFREKYNIKEEMVAPYEIFQIISIPGYDGPVAPLVCDKFKVTSQNDKEALAKAKEEAYNKGFYEGIMTVGACKGKKAAEAKIILREEMIAKGEATNYHEPEGIVMSRSGNECVVAFCDQWYLKYGDELWKSHLKEHVADPSKFTTYSEVARKGYLDTIDWIKEWGCSRSFGLGTRLPWDKQYLVESLSDSTIYMAYYTIAHKLHSDLYGKDMGAGNIPIEKITKGFWDYVFLGKGNAEEIGVEKSLLDEMRAEFLYWYPMDLRCSGKDLIKNHLTMALFNHQAIWSESPELWPRGYFCNGHILVDSKKMSKSEGNFFTVKQVLEFYGADATRVALADAGDSLEDANFVTKSADTAVLKLYTLYEWIHEAISKKAEWRKPKEGENAQTDFYDKVFQNEIALVLEDCKEAYEAMKFRDVLKRGFYDLTKIKEDYKHHVGSAGMREDLVQAYLTAQMFVLYPIAPHFCEMIYKNEIFPVLAEGSPKYLFEATYPPSQAIEIKYLKMQAFTVDVQENLRTTVEKLKKGKKGKNPAPVSYSVVTFIIAKKYAPWQETVLKILSANYSNGEVKPSWKDELKASVSGPDFKKSMQFGSFIIGDVKKRGEEALALEPHFDEQSLINIVAESVKSITGASEIKIIEKSEAEGIEKLASTAAGALPGKPAIMLE